MPFEVTKEPIERFLDKIVVASNGCWLWTAGKNHAGYGKFYAGGKDVAAHRWSYEWFHGPIPDGLTVDHLCNIRHCVNPAHLRPATSRENSFAEHSNSTARVNAEKDSCPRGHRYEYWNVPPSFRKRGERSCRSCILARSRSRYKGRKAEGPEWWMAEADRLYAEFRATA
ncbi:HNH endonuclease [Mycobacterium phage Smeagol]|nr:HNH endonuclease [Mycobacterium phage Smeagol]